jgi:hypothetical protein
MTLVRQTDQRPSSLCSGEGWGGGRGLREETRETKKKREPLSKSLGRGPRASLVRLCLVKNHILASRKEAASSRTRERLIEFLDVLPERFTRPATSSVTHSYRRLSSWCMDVLLPALHLKQP